jgi:hypothetical protein
MESSQATALFFSFGFFGIVGGLILWDSPVFGGFLVGLGISWFIVGFALNYAGREVNESGFLLGLVLGIISVILWLQLEPPQKPCEETRYFSHSNQRRVGEKVRCEDCFKLGKPSCLRTNTWAEALPCGEFEPLTTDNYA